MNRKARPDVAEMYFRLALQIPTDVSTGQILRTVRLRANCALPRSVSPTTQAPTSLQGDIPPYPVPRSSRTTTTMVITASFSPLLSNIMVWTTPRYGYRPTGGYPLALIRERISNTTVPLFLTPGLLQRPYIPSGTICPSGTMIRALIGCTT